MTSVIRPFLTSDVAAVAELRRRCFTRSAKSSPVALEEHFRRVFFEGPWCDEQLPSLVYERESGEIIGFLGVLARPMRFKGGPVRLAVPTQMMVDPTLRGSAGIQLMKKFLQGPQDLSMADSCNPAARAIWERLGARTATLYSLYWTLPLRPLDFLLRERAGRWPRRIGRPLARLVDPMLTVLPADEPPDDSAVLRAIPLDAPGLMECLAQLPRSFQLVPEYDRESLVWTMESLGTCSSAGGGPRGLMLRDSGGRLAGWYLYVRGSGDSAQVIQMGAAQGRMSAVLAHLAMDATKNGYGVVTGRLQPENIESLGGQFLRLSRHSPWSSGPWTIVHSRSESLLLEVLTGHAWLTRLEGEWWLDF